MAAMDEEQRQGIRTGELANMTMFNRCVACISYGDDNLIAIMESILEWFNQVIITEKFAKIGHVYTDEAKSGEIYTVRDLSEVAYLKRKFVWSEEAQRYIAPLNLEVVLEIVQWTKQGLQKDEITLANLDITMRELSLHGEKIYNKYMHEFKHVCEKYRIPFRFQDWYSVYAEVLNLPLTFHEGLELDSTDIFQTTNWIVHCVSADMQMSKGFAAKLVEERLTPEEHQRLKRTKHSIGDAVFHDKSHTIHLVTKQFYHDKPRDTRLFERALTNLNTACKVRGIKSLSMPPMQCGLDAKWTHLTVEGLERLLRKHLTDVEWEIYCA